MTVETVASVVAAGAAVVAVYFARDTVRESIAGRRDAERHHIEQIGEMQASMAAAAEQHATEMADRREVAAAERLSRQLEQLSKVTELVLRIRSAAADESAAGDANWTLRQGSRLPEMIVLLDASIAVMEAIGVPAAYNASELARVGRQGGVTVGAIASQSVAAFLELEQVMIAVTRGQTYVASSG